MGAVAFDCYADGRDIEEAFRNARDGALWEYGHGRYTGSVAEKFGYMTVVIPERTTVQDIMKRIPGARVALGDHDREFSTKQDHGDLEWLIKRFGKARAHRLVNNYEDKWGPAIAFELRGNERKQAREYLGVPKGSPRKVYRFVGTAPC